MSVILQNLFVPKIKNKIKRIVLVAINARFTHSALVLYYLREILADFNYDIILQEFSIKESPLEILDKLYFLEPDAVFFSAYIWNVDLLKAVLEDIDKILPNVLIGLGGPEASVHPEKWFENYQLRHIVIGQGEAAFRHLAENNFNLPAQMTEIENTKINQIPFPYHDSDISALKNKYVYYESSRGCAFNCSYCLSSRLEQKLEHRSWKLVKQELDWLLRQDFKIVKFIDRTFNADKSHAHAIWSYLIEKNPNTVFHFELHPLLLTSDDFDLLARSKKGLFQFEIGVQSIHSRTLEIINRTGNWKNIADNIRKLIALNNSHVHVDLIAGLPFEDLVAIQKSFDAVFALKPQHLQFGFLKILSGTGIASKIDEFELKFQKRAPYQILSTKWLNYEDMRHLIYIENALETFSNSAKFSRTMIFLLSLSSPFKLFSDLADFNKKHFYSAQWQDQAKFLLLFIENKFESYLDYALDCLRFDWCFIALAHTYPDFLNNGADILLNEIKNKVKAMAKVKNGELTKTELNSSIIFIAQNKKFKTTMPNSVALFIRKNSGKQIYFFDLPKI